MANVYNININYMFKRGNYNIISEIYIVSLMSIMRLREHIFPVTKFDSHKYIDEHKNI